MRALRCGERSLGQLIRSPRFIRVRGNNRDANAFKDKWSFIQFMAEVVPQCVQTALRIWQAILYFGADLLLVGFGLSTVQFRAPPGWNGWTV